MVIDERDSHVASCAREIGNATQSAFSQNDLLRFAIGAGFDTPEYYSISVVDAATGFNNRYTVPTIETNERVAFLKTTVLLYKPRR